MKTNRAYFLRASALIAFSFATAWVFQQWRLSDRPSFAPPTAAEAPTPEQQKVSKYVQQMQEISRLEEELRRAAESATKDRAAFQKKLAELNSLRGNLPWSVDFTPLDLPKRIPAGATDPDSVWRGQMQNARATMREAGIPAPR